MRSFLLFSTGQKPASGDGGCAGFGDVGWGRRGLLGVHQQTPTVAASPAVNDLKILDNNAQALQQMDQLLDSSSDDTSNPPTT